MPAPSSRSGCIRRHRLALPRPFSALLWHRFHPCLFARPAAPLEIELRIALKYSATRQMVTSFFRN